MPFSDITEHSLKYGALCAEFELGIKNLGTIIEKFELHFSTSQE